MDTSGLPPHPTATAAALWPPTRAEALERLATFLPNAGRRYAEARDYDFGPEDRANVSTLSPWVRHRLITEEEVVRAVLAEHGPRAAEKFIQEVLWRTYWKGWLEMRPSVWTDYRDAVDRWRTDLDEDDGLHARFAQATEARTGIACFDAWVRELIELGYLHNHARMWFASIWIFTLRLPWELGADFFLRYLLDGDPASNTLSWRWVAGLQTHGKTYLARPSNIARFTGGRFAAADGLATEAPAPAGPPPPPITPIPSVARVEPSMTSGLLITEEDGHAESLALPRGAIVAAVGLVCTAERSPLPAGEKPLAFARGAVADGLARASAWLGCAATGVQENDRGEAIEAWAAGHGIQQVITAYPAVGPVQRRLVKLKGRLARFGVSLIYVPRAWDRALWPHAQKGFFPFRENVPEALRALDIGR